MELKTIYVVSHLKSESPWVSPVGLLKFLFPLPPLTVPQFLNLVQGDLEIHKDNAVSNDGSTSEFGIFYWGI